MEEMVTKKETRFLEMFRVFASQNAFETDSSRSGLGGEPVARLREIAGDLLL